MIAGALSRDEMLAFLQSGAQSPLSPPPVVFPLVWTALYVLMGIGMAQVQLYGDGNTGRARNLFLIQLGVNFLWPLIFFNAQAYGFALLWLLLLLILVLATTLEFRQQYPGGAAANPLSALALLCGRAELFRIPPQQLSNGPSI